MRRRTATVWYVMAVGCVIGGACPASADRDGSVPAFNRDVRPILADKCFKCHGPDSAARKASLRLDVREEVLKDRDGTKVIVPGEPNHSELIARIFADDESDRMPPAKSELALTDEQKQTLRQWIADGAMYEPHWSLIPLPDRVVEPPVVKDEQWPRGDLDRFVLSRLEAEGLAPSSESPRERWLRRATFDLIGLAPTQPEIDVFLADGSAEAYERVVDRLLASPRFGEKMAVQWLDVARYADSFGYQSDIDTYAWPYRDWVIQAFNDNLPFDQFITYQLAGDLLPDATTFQRLATAFLRVHRKTQEGGSIEEEFRQDGISDRVHTVGTTMLGLTVECARCHDHKYDPITMRDYYSLGAFFNSIDEWGLLHGNGVIQPNPVLFLSTPEQTATLARQREAIGQAERSLANLRQSREPVFQQWLSKPKPEWLPPVDLAGDYDLEHAMEGQLRNRARPTEPGTLNDVNQFILAKTGFGVKLTGDDPIGLTHGGCRHMHDPISVSCWLKPGEAYQRGVVFHNSSGWDVGYNGYELTIEEGRLRWMFIREWPGNCIAVEVIEKIPVNSWSHVTVTYDGSARATGLLIYMDGQPAKLTILHDKLTKDSGDEGRLDFGERRRSNGLRNATVDEIKIFSRAITPIEVAQYFDGRSLVEALTRANHSAAELTALRDYYFSAIDEETRAVTVGLHKARTALRETMDGVREVPVMEEMPEPRPAFVLARGAYDAPSEPVSRNTPAALPPFPSDAPRNRLGFARWLTHRNHPLTARVAVNRIWQEFFDQALVVTAENFGTQGQYPSHPELLDWLARDFIDHGWDLKRSCRQIVLSATYRQDSRATPELRDKDPDNALLARGPARRLSAEMLRDNALALGGLLRPEIGGPPAKPYQPDGSMWLALNNFLPEYQRDTGAGLYRRSLYTFWRRTTPPPGMLIFDAANRDVCIARRQLTLTPLQPLALLNDPQFVEAARALGQRMLRYGGETPDHRVMWAFREVTGRAATDKELAELKALYAEQLDYFRADASRCEKLLAVGEYVPDPDLSKVELAAAATTASALLNLDATITLR